ncbi:MAG TPA: geranylgeranylglyceryl/heptaprenylglyceryl phosphate synthase [Saprospiraceae bacterium]|nr:geranylgeranylglyceryl/heptaprenylglyceryl phosphate synthase [Saprospiraceae bacterium]
MVDQFIRELQKKKSLGIKSLAVLIDPDHQKLKNLDTILELSAKYQVDYFFLGGSLIVQDRIEECIKLIRENTQIPVFLFPGNGFQLSAQADALLFLSLLSGRNPDYLIGKHVEAAPKLMVSKIEVIPTAYMLIDGGKSNTAAYISQTIPIPHDKAEIAQTTALAGQFLGMKLVFMDAGSGAKRPVSSDMIQKVSKVVEIPLIIGGGIRDAETAHQSFRAGADLVVVGNAIEEDPFLIRSLMAAAKEMNLISYKKNESYR